MGAAGHSARVLVVEDEPSIAEMVGLHLRHAGYEVSFAINAEEARRAVSLQPPDLVLLDWMLPGQSGESLLRRWRSEVPTRDLPVILLTAKSSEHDKVAGLEAGADDYVTKPFSNKELIARINAMFRRVRPAEPKDVLSLGPLELDLHGREVKVRGQLIKIGPSEFKLLAFLMKNPERVFTRVHLLSAVWDDPGHMEERTVDVHIKRLREALGGCSSMVQTVRGAGYKLTAMQIA